MYYAKIYCSPDDPIITTLRAVREFLYLDFSNQMERRILILLFVGEETLLCSIFLLQTRTKGQGKKGMGSEHKDH